MNVDEIVVCTTKYAYLFILLKVLYFPNEIVIIKSESQMKSEI